MVVLVDGIFMIGIVFVSMGMEVRSVVSMLVDMKMDTFLRDFA